MNIDSALKILTRLTFIAATLAIFLSVLEWFAQMLNMSLVGYMYSPGRMFELTSTLLIFASVLLLREIRNELRRK